MERQVTIVPVIIIKSLRYIQNNVNQLFSLTFLPHLIFRGNN